MLYGFHRYDLGNIYMHTQINEFEGNGNNFRFSFVAPWMFTQRLIDTFLQTDILIDCMFVSFNKKLF